MRLESWVMGHASKQLTTIFAQLRP